MKRAANSPREMRLSTDKGAGAEPHFYPDTFRMAAAHGGFGTRCCEHHLGFPIC
ncbi:hypothetical protein HMPREF9237_01167 [Actinotignum schaalii FB123-CNA-2]|uniref:Uncharacterized protein n=1 Tax=Actinotignum schaalii FB123-CNA-2 TaxID=883067 RepID=S2VGJ3_9ACTO|nr:hypothetical protein HMPREF9237_01167 [Actinotignum schaalii FB123-CNA-2]